MHEQELDIILSDIDADKYGVDNTQISNLTIDLKTTIEEREILLEQFQSIKQLEINPNNLKTFRDLRLKFQKNRTQGIEKWHKTAKEIPLRMGQLIDAIKNKQCDINKTHETYLENAEKHYERLEKERIENLHNERLEKILPYIENTTGLDLGNMSEEVFNNFYIGSKKTFEDRIEAQKKAEKEALENQRKQQILNNRLIEIGKYGKHAFKQPTLETTEKEWNDIIKTSESNLATYELEQEKIRKENERLRKIEEESKQAAIKLQERNRKLSPYITYIRDYDKVLNMSDEDFDKELKSLNEQAMLQMKYEAEQREKLNFRKMSVAPYMSYIEDYEELINSEDSVFENSLKHLKLLAKDQKEKEDKIREENEQLERIRLEEEKRERQRLYQEQLLKQKPEREQTLNWVNQFSLPETSLNTELTKAISSKFNDYKKWAIIQINKNYTE
jgi:hypothetical protein